MDLRQNEYSAGSAAVADPTHDRARNGASRGGIHIVHGVLTLDVGGLERLVLDLAVRAVSGGDRVTVLCIEHEGELAAAAREAGIRVIALHKPPGCSRKTLREAHEWIGRLQPDVIHTHQIGVLWYLGTAARRLNIPSVIHTEHSDFVMQTPPGWRRARARWWWWYAGRLAERFCCVSDDIAETARRGRAVAAQRLRVVRNGIDTNAFGQDIDRLAMRAKLGIPTTAPVVGTVGRLVEIKQQQRLIAALADLRPDFPELRLLLVGDGPERANLQRMARELDVADRTVFAGYQSQPAPYLHVMDAFALCSRHEGLPLALLEAWAAKLPIASSAVGGICKVVEDGQTGLLFPEGDQRALAESLRALLEQPELAERLAHNGQALVRERYSLERMDRDYRQLYRETSQPREELRT